MKKILFVSNFYSSYISAGTSQRTRDIKKGLINMGWDCKVVTIKRKKLPKYKEPDNKDIVALETFNEKYPLPHISIFKLYDLIKNSSVVHIIDHWSVLNILSVFFCFLSKTPYVYSPCGAIKPIGRNIFIEKLYNFIFLDFIIKNSSYIFAITKNEFNEIKKLSKNKLNIRVVPNGIWKSKKFNPQNTIQIQSKFKNINIAKKFILYVGRLSYVKGPDILFDAFLEMKLRKDYSLIFAGPDDNMQNKILNKYKNINKQKNIVFLGPLTAIERDYFMQKATLVVIPSRKEAMSMVALESSIVGTPFLATNSCGLDDFIKNSAGFICKANSKSLSNKLNYILNDYKTIKTIGINAKKYVTKNYSWEFILKKINLYLNELHINKSKLKNRKNK